MFEDQAKQELFETVKPFHACKQEDGQLVSSYILNMKSYLDTLELLGYPMPNGLGVSLIFNSLNKDCEQFIQNYNMHSMRKTIVELHVMLKLNEKGLPKKNETPLVLSIRGGNRMRAAIEAIGSIDLILPNGLVIDLDNFHYAISRLVDNGYMHTFVNYVHNGVSKRRNQTLLEMVRSMMNSTTLAKSFWVYALESDARILNMVLTKKVDKTPYEIWNGKALNLSDLKFFENSLTLQEASRSYTLHEASGSHTLHEESGCDVGLKLLQELDTQPSYDTKNNTMRYGFYVDVEEHELGNLDEHLNYKAALSDLESDKWVDAMNVEMQSMKDNQVWCLVDLPPNGRTVRTNWLFKKKTDMDGNVHTFKACLVAKEDIYMVQPEGFGDPKHPRKVCKLQRSIYRLKQASRSWNKRFDEEIKKVGLTQNPVEPGVYVKASESNVAFLVLYVNDILIMGNNVTMQQDVLSCVRKCFYMKDLGEAAYILGIKITRDRSERLISFSQCAYDKILRKFKIENFKHGNVPIQEKSNLSKALGAKTPNEVNRMQRVPYASAIGSIIRFQQNPSKAYLFAAKTILKYLRNTKDMVLVYGGNPETEAVDGKSAKQSTIAMSSTKAEYIAVAEASMEAV
ncbi:retrotransposon protein, putative, ty1-copia subclass [Tanacetum coccineum]